MLGLLVVAFALGMMCGALTLLAVQRDTRPSHTPCRCGCGRLIPSNSNWDGYHGPS